MKLRRKFMSTVVVAAAAVGLLVAGSGSAGVSFPAAFDGQIAYFEYMDDKDITCFDIFLVNPDGTGKLNLTHNDTVKFDVSPNWSPDGTRIAFTRYHEAGGSDVFVVSPYDDTIENLTGPAPFDGIENAHPTWSPDGSQIVFSSNRDGNFDLYVIKSSGGNPEQLTFTKAPVQNVEPDWSPSGGMLVFSRTGRKPNAGAGLFTLAIGTDVARRLTKAYNPVGDRGAAWSPNGKWIAYSSDRMGNQDLYVIRPDGAVNRRLTWSKKADREPSWSPDGETLVFVRGTGATELWMLGFAGARDEWQLTFDGILKGAPDWGPAGPTDLYVK